MYGNCIKHLAQAEQSTSIQMLSIYGDGQRDGDQHKYIELVMMHISYVDNRYIWIFFFLVYTLITDDPHNKQMP